MDANTYFVVRQLRIKSLFHHLEEDRHLLTWCSWGCCTLHVNTQMRQAGLKPRLPSTYQAIKADLGDRQSRR